MHYCVRTRKINPTNKTRKQNTTKKRHRTRGGQAREALGWGLVSDVYLPTGLRMSSTSKSGFEGICTDVSGVIPIFGA